jgi:hypothetical protein
MVSIDVVESRIGLALIIEMGKLRVQASCDDNLELLSFFFFKSYLCMWVHCRCPQTYQKRASDIIIDGCELPCGFWELNSGPLEEQMVLLTTEPSLQSLLSCYKKKNTHIKYY